MANITIPTIGTQVSLYPFKLENAQVLFQRLDVQNSFWEIELVVSPPILFPMLENKNSLFFTRLKGGETTSGISVPTLRSTYQQTTFTLGRVHGIFF